ncbi:adenylyltransferase/cytidyltransferase family protein [Methanolobus sp. ZRKC3]
MVKVLATGTFDLLHPGHILFLEKARELGDELCVIVARESMIKHKPKPIVPDDQRLKMVNSLKVVDYAFLGSESDIFEPIGEINPDIIALGYDQTFQIESLKEELQKRGFDSEVVRIKESKTCTLCSSGRIIQKILIRYGNKT